MATSNVDIANIALRILGEPPITSLTGTQKAQTLSAQAIDPAREEVFMMHPWSTLITRKALSQLASPSNFTEFSYVYSQPSDSIRILHIRPQNTTGVNVETSYFNPQGVEDGEPYIIESGNIYTDVNDAYATYIRLETNPAVLPNYLIDAIGAAIAKRIAYSLVQNVQVSQYANQYYYTALQFALQMDAKSQRNTVAPPRQISRLF